MSFFSDTIQLSRAGDEAEAVERCLWGQMRARARARSMLTTRCLEARGAFSHKQVSRFLTQWGHDSVVTTTARKTHHPAFCIPRSKSQVPRRGLRRVKWSTKLFVGRWPRECFVFGKSRGCRGPSALRESLTPGIARGGRCGNRRTEHEQSQAESIWSLWARREGAGRG